MKTFDIKDVYSWHNAEEAKDYIGREGYFSDFFSENPDEWEKSTLLRIHQGNSITNIFENKKTAYGLFLPSDKVKEVEEPKKWRPFKSWEEFHKTTGLCVGNAVYIRSEGWDYFEVRLITMLRCHKNDDALIGLSGIQQLLSFRELFERYQYKLVEPDEWKFFGIEEDIANEEA